MATIKVPYSYRQFKNSQLATKVDKYTHHPTICFWLCFLTGGLLFAGGCGLLALASNFEFRSFPWYVVIAPALIFAAVGFLWMFFGSLLVPFLSTRFDWAGKIARREMIKKLRQTTTSASTSSASTSSASTSSAPLPGFLVRPDDPIAKQFFEKEMIAVSDPTCHYRTELYGPAADSAPKVIDQGSTQIHVYSKVDSPSWYVVTTLNSPGVRTTPLENSVLTPLNMSRLFHAPSAFLQVPDSMSLDGFQEIKLHELGAWPAYDKLHNLDESRSFCYVFSLKDQVYKDYILTARKGDYNWRLECVTPAQNGNPDISPADFVPPGYMFGSFGHSVS